MPSSSSSTRGARSAKLLCTLFFFFNDTATTEIYTTYDTLSLHDALPISRAGRVYPRGLRLDRYAMRMRHQGREPDLSALPPLVTSPAIIVAWDYVPIEPPPGAACGFAEGAPSRVDMEVVVDGHPATPPAIQPLTVIFDRARIRELLAPYETDVARVRFLAILDPARLRAPSA